MGVRSYVRAISRFGLFLCAATIGTAPSLAQGQSSHLELVATEPDAPYDTWPSITSGSITQEAKGSYSATYSWNAPPQTIGEEGFTLHMSVNARAEKGSRVSAVMGASGDFTFDPEDARASALAESGEGASGSQDVKVTPVLSGSDGSIFSLRVSAQGPGVTYRYKLIQGSAPPSGGPLTATITDCPATITISELPSVSCHLTISGFRHGTDDPVEVILPDSVDSVANHKNGLQLTVTAGTKSPYNMTDPYEWLLTIFACPGQKGAAVSCNGMATAPGPVSVPILVRQKGLPDAQATLSMTAVAGPNSVITGKTPTGPNVTSTNQPAGAGQLGAEIECPPDVVISQYPPLNCHIIITGWLRDTAAPVSVSFPGEDAYGNHPNGIQIIGRGSEDIYEWDGDSHQWGIFVFACPEQQGMGANCDTISPHGAVAGPQTVAIHIEQEGLLPADITLAINATLGPNSVLVGTGSSTGPPPTGSTPSLSTSQPASPGQIGAALDCPPEIEISALPGVACNILITGWTHDSADPVSVKFVGATVFGNLPNGLQIQGEGEEDVFEMGDEPYHWEIGLFACPGQQGAGVNCEGSVAVPGPLTANIHVAQKGLQPADIVLVITAVPHP